MAVSVFMAARSVQTGRCDNETPNFALFRLLA
jgi:hypothetical protein